jgi:PAS domain S-box-containing protein
LLLPLNSENQPMHLESEKFIQSALDALSAHISLIDETGKIIGVNIAWQRFAVDNSFKHPTYGIGLNYLEVCKKSAELGSKWAHKIAEGLVDVIEGRVSEFEMEYPCHSPTEKRWFVVRVSRFLWNNDIRVIVSHQNISDLRRSQLEVLESKERIQAVLDNIGNAVLTISPKGKIETCNPAATRIFEYDIEALTQLFITDLMTAPFNTEGTFRLFVSEQGHELIGKRSDDSQFPMYFALNRMVHHGGTSYIAIIQDMTKIKQMQAEILEKEQIRVALQKERELRDLKDRFFSMMSHELKTPLASIRLSHGMLTRYGDRIPEEEKAQYLDNINMQVEHLSEMVSDVLTLSKSERTEQGFTPEQTDLITYCRDIIEAFQINHYQTHNFEFECPDPIIIAEFDKKLLRRALTNLIGNAIKYSPEGGIIQLNLSKNKTFALIQVIDSGIGIPSEDHDYIFSTFHRASNVGVLPGTGLGLAITKQVIDLHDGELRFESTVGQGTSFTIHLPLKVAE